MCPTVPNSPESGVELTFQGIGTYDDKANLSGRAVWGSWLSKAMQRVQQPITVVQSYIAVEKALL